jgi:hypothetical protein
MTDNSSPERVTVQNGAVGSQDGNGSSASSWHTAYSPGSTIRVCDISLAE